MALLAVDIYGLLSELSGCAMWLIMSSPICSYLSTSRSSVKVTWEELIYLLWHFLVLVFLNLQYPDTNVETTFITKLWEWQLHSKTPTSPFSSNFFIFMGFLFWNIGQKITGQTLWASCPVSEKSWIFHCFLFIQFNLSSNADVCSIPHSAILLKSMIEWSRQQFFVLHLVVADVPTLC